MRLIVAAGAMLVTSACGSSQSSNTSSSSPNPASSTSVEAANTFTVDGEVSANADVVYQNGECKFPDATFQTGDVAVLRGADSTILATDHLKVGPNEFVATGGVCSLIFHFDKVMADEPGYQLSVGAVGPIVVTEHQLRDKNFQVIPRSAMTALMGNPPIKLYPES